MEDVINALHSFPLLQFAVCALVAIVGVFGWMKGERDRKPAPGFGLPAVQMFFDGPLIKALDLLQGIYRLMVELRAEIGKFADERNRKMDEQTQLLREIKDLLAHPPQSPPRRR